MQISAAIFDVITEATCQIHAFMFSGMDCIECILDGFQIKSYDASVLMELLFQTVSKLCDLYLFQPD